MELFHVSLLSCFFRYLGLIISIHLISFYPVAHIPSLAGLTGCVLGISLLFAALSLPRLISFQLLSFV
jgi:hypothetical protein